jgi:hypothetical protein
MPFYHERAVVGLKPARKEVVVQAFQKLDRDGSGEISFEEALAAYDVSRHPLVQEGVMSPTMAVEALIRQFEPSAQARDGKISWEEFETYYLKVSQEVDRGHSVDKEGFFRNLVRKAWRLDEDEKPILATTNIIPDTLGLPSGLARAKNMDLVFPSESGLGLQGFRGAVKTVFARGDIPECLRGYFALHGELERIPVSFLPVRAATLPPYDFVWPTEDGTWTGYKGVINSNVNLAAMPEDLRCLVRTQQESASLGAVYQQSAPQVANPHFRKSSDIYGEGTEVECAKLADLKRNTFNGKAAGTRYLGRTGKFTNGAPPPSAGSGLNCGSVKKAWGL